MPTITQAVEVAEELHREAKWQFDTTLQNLIQRSQQSRMTLERLENSAQLWLDGKPSSINALGALQSEAANIDRLCAVVEEKRMNLVRSEALVRRLTKES